MLEQVVERQFYDRVLAVMFDVEPRDITNVPLRLLHKFETPVIEVATDPGQFNMMMNLVDRGASSMEKVMDKMVFRIGNYEQSKAHPENVDSPKTG